MITRPMIESILEYMVSMHNSGVITDDTYQSVTALVLSLLQAYDEIDRLRGWKITADKMARSLDLDTKGRDK